MNMMADDLARWCANLTLTEDEGTTIGDNMKGGNKYTSQKVLVRSMLLVLMTSMP